MNRLPYVLLERDLEEFVYDEKKGKILLWTKASIGIVDIKHKGDEIVFERGPRVNWIYEKGRNIQKCFWFLKGTHVLFYDGSSVKIVELNDGEVVSVEDIMKIKDHGGVYYSDASGALWVLDSESGTVTACELVPERERQFLVLPELGADRERDTGDTP